MKAVQLLIAVVIVVVSAQGQPREGRKKELSLSGSYQSYSLGGSSGSSSAFLVTPRLGFFVYEGLEIEPELAFVLPSGGDPAYMFNGNIAYNFLSAGKNVPFLLFGYGLANTVPIFNVPFTQIGFRVGVFNLGVGLKGYLKEDIAIRIEYRYQNFSGHGPTFNYGFGSVPEELNARIHSVQFGLSVLL